MGWIGFALNVGESQQNPEHDRMAISGATHVLLLRHCFLSTKRVLDSEQTSSLRNPQVTVDRYITA